MSTPIARESRRSRAEIVARVRALYVARTVVFLFALTSVARATARLERRLRFPLDAASALAWTFVLELALGVVAWSVASGKISKALEDAEDAAASARERNVEKQTTHAQDAGGLWLATKNGDVEGVMSIVTSNPETLRERGPVGETPTHLMILYGGASSLDASKQLMAAKYVGERHPWTLNDVYVGEEYNGESTLHIAVVNENIELVRWLLLYTPDVKTLLEARAIGKFFAKGSPCYYGEFALSFASSTGQCDLIDVLLRAGADPAAQDSHGNTCLHMAVMHNQPEAYDKLCSWWVEQANEASKYDLERMLNADGLTPLLFAARSGFRDMFEFLIERSCVTEWSYGPVTCKRMPLYEVDTSNGSKSALKEIVDNDHEDLLELPLIRELIQRKWDVYIGKLYISSVWQAVSFVLAMTFVHIMPYKEVVKGELEGFGLTVAHTMKTAILGVCVFRLWSECCGLRRDVWSGQSAVSTMFCATYIVSVVARFHNDVVADALLASSFLLAWFYVGCLFMGFQSIGHFVVMIHEIIINDVLKFGLILAMFLIAFSTAIYIVLRPPTERSFEDFAGQLLSCFAWLADGGFQEDVAEGAARGKPLAVLLLASFTIIGSIVLLNLLVAMMGDTYSNVSQNAVVKWRLQRAKIALTLERAIPPGRRDRLDRGVWIDVARARFLQVQLVNGLTAIQSGAEA